MDFGVLGSIFLLSLFFRPFVSLQPNIDAFFVSDFFQKMGANASACSLQEGAVCDTKQHHIVRLVASGLGLSGAIPDATISKLRMLQTLDLSNNSITTFSSDFWSLGYSLKTLNLSHNQITGTLSSNLGNFGLLQTLDLSFNNLSGSIPASITSLFNLKHLKLAGNVFAGNIPPGILNCQNLVSVDLSLNKLNGTLPYGFGAALPKLKTLNLAGNEIHGRSSDFSGLNSISYLNISMNLFRGSVMGVFLVALEVMDLSRNRFQGHISQVHYLNSSFNWSRLLFLDMSENQISGEIFHDLNDAHNLEHLNLAHNRFSTQPFPQVDRLSKLEYLNMSNTNLIGKIPIEISQLSSLSTLDLSENHLTGGIPGFDRQNIQVLDLSLNNLTGRIPFSLLEKIIQMKKFNFSYNNLTFCTSKFSPRTFQTAFIWSMDNCPIAVNPHFLPTRKKTKDKQLKLALVISLSLACFVVGLICLALGCRRETRRWAVKQVSHKEETTISGPFSFQTDSTSWVADVKLATTVPVVIFEKPLLNFTFADLLCATSYFDRGSLLAEGRYGPVYRGFLPGGIHVAVKVFVNGFTMSDEEASRELDYLGRIKHPNLVPLTGYCMAGERKIIMYDYMNNGNLQNFLHDLPLGVQATEDWSTDTWEEDESSGIQHVGSEGLLMTWGFRHKIALGTARALAFLHHGCSPPITLQYVKASNVYLDSNWEARVSDFGLSRIFGSCLEEEITPGYVAPEFSEPATSSPTPKSDVYGFGVILFELITGKKPTGDEYPEDKESNLVGWVRGLVRRKQSLRAVDPKIRGTAPENRLEAALRIGYLCTAQLPTKRPTMQQVLGLLKDIQPSGDT